MNEASHFNSSMVCEMRILEVLRDTEVVRGTVMNWFDHGNLLNYILNNPITSEEKFQLVSDLSRHSQHNPDAHVPLDTGQRHRNWRLPRPFEESSRGQHPSREPTLLESTLFY